MTIFLIGLPWLALVAAAMTDHKEGNDGSALAFLIGAVLIMSLVLVGAGLVGLQ
jgi:hypothetical protein